MCEVVLNVKYNSGKKNQKENINNETFRESRVIQATSFAEAKEIMNEKIRDDYNNEESWKRSTVIKTNFVSVLPITQAVMKSDIKTVRMKDLGTNILNYDSVKEFKDFLQTEQEFGTCVIDNIVGMYNKSLGITREMFIDFCSKYYTSPLDVKPVEWDERDGVDANCLRKFL